MARPSAAQIVMDTYDMSCPREMRTTAAAFPRFCEPL
jgi:hypothetical protein